MDEVAQRARVVDEVDGGLVLEQVGEGAVDRRIDPDGGDELGLLDEGGRLPREVVVHPRREDEARDDEDDEAHPCEGGASPL